MISKCLGPCPDSGLQNVQNRVAMTQAGWILMVDPDQTGYISNCGTSSFWGYKVGSPVGKVSATFKGYGNATLNFGNCYSSGSTYVYLNNIRIGSASANQNSIKVNFAYKPHDILRLEEVGTGIVKINALQLRCSGKRYFLITCL